MRKAKLVSTTQLRPHNVIKCQVHTTPPNQNQNQATQHVLEKGNQQQQHHHMLASILKLTPRRRHCI